MFLHGLGENREHRKIPPKEGGKITSWKFQVLVEFVSTISEYGGSNLYQNHMKAVIALIFPTKWSPLRPTSSRGNSHLNYSKVQKHLCFLKIFLLLFHKTNLTLPTPGKTHFKSSHIKNLSSLQVSPASGTTFEHCSLDQRTWQCSIVSSPRWFTAME